MSAVLETDIRQREVWSVREEGARVRFFELREGLRSLFRKRGIPLCPGVSGFVLLSILSQTMEIPEQAENVVECLSADWHDEYKRFVGQIALLTGHTGIDAETKPRAVVDSIESHLAHLAEHKV